MQAETSIQKESKGWIRLIIAISVVIPIAVGVLLFGSLDLGIKNSFVYSLPHINAVINSFTAIALLVGLFFIRRQNVVGHKNAMTTAFVLGSVFLISYVVYHSAVPSTKFGGEGMIRIIYFVLLLSHILLAAIVVPLVLFAIYFAISKKIASHKKIVKYTWPIWFYVSVSGVIVYLMIKPYYTF